MNYYDKDGTEDEPCDGCGEHPLYCECGIDPDSKYEKEKDESRRDIDQARHRG